MTENDFYERVGGEATFRKLVSAFYAGVAQDELLKPMYPEKDLKGAEDRLRMFLEQYWGGPSTYQELRGHPRLRMRHAGFKINPEAREHWLKHMRSAVDELNLPALYEAELWSYLERAATSLINTLDD